MANTDYYWRVRSYVPVGQWSQVWRTRFDSSLGLSPIGTVPELIRPTTGFEFAELTPLLEWFPVNGAASYDVQISRDSGFNEIVDSATVAYPAYAPTQSLAQRNLGDQDFGIYYWRVRQSGGAWSEGRRFQVAAQSQWKLTRTLGDAANRLQIGSDPADRFDDYELTSLQVAQAKDYWYFGFQVPTAPAQNVTYALYLDIDHLEGSGATYDARGYNLTTISAHRPEYAIYVLQESAVFQASKVYLYHWNGSGWDTVSILDSVGGYLSYSSGYLELQIPNTLIGYQDTTGSYAVSLLSLPAGSGQPQDSVPSDPAIPGAGPVSRFANVTERMNLVMPPNDAGVDPSTYPSILPFYWDWPILAPWSGAIMKAYLDPQFTTEKATYTLTSSTAYYSRTNHAWADDFTGDNTYYWRIRPQYRVGSLFFGAWSQGWRFERQGFVPQNLQTSVTSATPTFSWDLVEGASSYDLEVDDDPAFASKAINISTRQNSYTSDDTLANATYYWRVRARRDGGVINNWTAAQSFTLSLPTPTGLNHSPSGVVWRTPTLCWTPLIVNDMSSNPVLAAWKYRVQVSKDPTFSSIFDNIDTEQSCWTPIKGYDDGQYYWRVAMIDGQGRLGNYGAAETFTKQYPITTLVSPTSGLSMTSTPTFVWTPVNGAAKYKFETSQVSTFSPIYDSVTTDSIRWTPTKTYLIGATYYWRVAIVDADGKVGPVVGSTIIISTNSTIFADVPNTYWAWQYIERLYNAGITGGCATTPNLLYCPENTVTRAQMAVFLLKSIYGPDYPVPPVGVSTGFSDVSTSHWAAAWIKQLAAERITGGCGTGIYCPENPVTRAQMAVFLLKAKYGPDYTPPALDGGSGFSDVPDNYWAAVWIKQLATEGITGGCGTGIYCPESPVTRAQMAVFIVKTFNLP